MLCSSYRPVCGTAEELSDLQPLWLLLHCLRSILGSLSAHLQGMKSRTSFQTLSLTKVPPKSDTNIWVHLFTGSYRSSLLYPVFLFMWSCVCLCVCVHWCECIYVYAQKSYGEVSLMDCMRLFTKEDVLDGDEKPVSILHPELLSTFRKHRYIHRTQQTKAVHLSSSSHTSITNSHVFINLMLHRKTVYISKTIHEI